MGKTLPISMFDAPAVLTLHRKQHVLRRHAGPLGALLNRVRRMRVMNGASLEITCERTVYRGPDIDALIQSVAYQTWLTLPLSQRTKFNPRVH
jgi:hypothetical protein